MTIACLGLTLFGIVSFTTARELSTQRQIALLQQLNDEFLASLDLTTKHPTLGKLVNALEMDDSNYYLALFDTNNQVAFEYGNQQIKQKVLNQLPFAIMNKRNVGSLPIDDKLLIWTTTPAAHFPYTLIHAQQTTRDDFSLYMNRMGTPLALTTIVVIWIGIWTSLSIASLFNKVTEQKATLAHKALHDDLTKLPNRASLIDAIEKAIDEAKKDKKDPQSLTLLVVDLNHFKEINDSLGYHCGDELLRQVGTRLPNILTHASFIARSGGDEFAVLFSNTKAFKANQLGEKLLHALEPAFEVEGHSLYVAGTLGIASYPEHAEDARTLAQRAEMAMYTAKSRRKHMVVYDKSIDRSNVEQLVLVHDLRTVIDEELLELHYQPKLNLKTNTIVGVEALARWKHPSRGDISPEYFIRLAEKTGLIRPLTSWALSTAINQCAEWRRRGLHLRMAINLSASSLHDPKLEYQIGHLLSKVMLPPSSLELEITETAMMTDPVQAHDLLTRLDALGIRISIDDFGTGYSSLSYLKRLPVDEIKIDKSFVLNMINQNNDDSIVLATIGLAHDLGMEVVAEGVEDQTSQDVLETYGCNTVQGFHICNPLPAEELTKLLSPSKPIIVDASTVLPEDFNVVLKEHKA